MSFGYGGGPAPDWQQLASQAEAARKRKRAILLIVSAVVATLVVAGVVAAAVITSGDGSPSADDSSLPSPQKLDDKDADPTFSDVKPPPDPMDFISTAKNDKAPLSVGTLFPDKKASIAGRDYNRGATSTTKGCTKAGQEGLGPVLKKHGCDTVYRATYTRSGVAVTIGVAVFDNADKAGTAAKQAKGNVTPLPGSGVPQFCRGTSCRLTSNSLGRYAYFTIAGYTNGKSVVVGETKSKTAVKDAAELVHERLMARGRSQASAAAEAEDQ